MKIRLDDWLKREFYPPPAIRTARRYIEAGKIYPPPVKVGHAVSLRACAHVLHLSPILPKSHAHKKGQPKLP